MRETTIVTLYKNEGDRSDCSNYRGIIEHCGEGLRSGPANQTSETCLTCLPTIPVRVQSRKIHHRYDLFSTPAQLQEKFREQGMPLYVAFIDLTKAFDLVSRKGLFRLLEPCQDPQHVFSAELAGPCTAHGGRPLDERHPIWTTHQWCDANWTTSPQIQGCLQS